MRRPHTYAYKKRAAGKGAELRGVEVWLRRYRRGWTILNRAYCHEHGYFFLETRDEHSSAWWVAFHELNLKMERLETRRVELRCGVAARGTPIAFPSLTGPLFPKG